MKLFLNSEEEKNEIIGTSTFRIFLKRYVDYHEDNILFFNNDLTIHECQKIIAIMKKSFSNLEINHNVLDRIEKLQFNIDNRYRIGNGIKARETTFRTSFANFSEIVNAKMVRPLTEEQLWNAFYMFTMRNASNFSVPGSGKTATVLGTYAYWRHLGEIETIVMIGPKNSFGSWIDEFKICFGVENNGFFLNIHSNNLSNAKKRKYALKFDSGNKDLVLINYDSVQSLEKEIAEVITDKSFVVLDEVHKIKNPTGVRASVIKNIVSEAGAIVALTGTPIPNSYIDIFNLLQILYPEDYDNFFGFTTSFLKEPSSFEIESINEKIRPFFCRMTKENLGVPNPNTDKIIEVIPKQEENGLFKIISQAYRKNLFALLIRTMQLEATPRELLNVIESKDLKSVLDDDVASIGDIEIIDYSESTKELINSIDITTKVALTVDLIKELVSESKPVIVWCILTASIREIERHCKNNNMLVRVINGELPLEERLDLIADFKDGKIEVLITNPHTLAESVSLHMVCHDAIYFEYSYNLVHLLQSKDRIHRLGLPENQYTQYYFLNNTYFYRGEDVSISKRIYDRLKEKEEIMINAIENDVLENVYSTEEDLQKVFEWLTGDD